MLTKVEFQNAKVTYDDTGILIGEEANGYAMYKSEKPYIKESVRKVCEKIKPKSVLEVGFGYGYTADEFQDYGIERHVIIEAHPEIYKEALKWSKGKEGVEVIFNFWQDVRLDEGFDLVYFDPYEIIEHNAKDVIDSPVFNSRWFTAMYSEVLPGFDIEESEHTIIFNVGDKTLIQDIREGGLNREDNVCDVKTLCDLRNQIRVWSND